MFYRRVFALVTQCPFRYVLKLHLEYVIWLSFVTPLCYYLFSTELLRNRYVVFKVGDSLYDFNNVHFIYIVL